EASTDYILEQQAKGVKEPWNEDGFQLEVLKLHLMREEAVKNRIKEDQKNRIFTDRGLLDHEVYSILRNKTATPTYK
ncbi:DEAD/DEAH box helicase family protein, partial [Streptomyces europaeiscabiei]|uniref:hypothetical protein n=1 Tax=Streptomyces europaeiscabiei TaxID=146819 RepID=UPI0038F5D461